jgi:hypothetical protein
MRTIFIVLLTGITLTSCTTIHHGQVISLDYGQPVKIENRAYGYASSTYVLGVGGNKTNLLLQNAKDNLIKNRPLGKSERYVNQNLNISISNYILFVKAKYILTADVISASDTSSYEPPVTEFIKGETLTLANNKVLGEFIGNKNDNRIFIEKTSENGVRKLKTRSRSKVYKIAGDFKGYKIGQTVKLNKDFLPQGKIIGLGMNHVIVIDSHKETAKVKYEDIISK